MNTLNHPRLSATLAALTLSSLAGVAHGATPGTTTGKFAPGEKVAAPEFHAPATVSRTFVMAVTPDAGKASVEIPAVGGSGLLVWTAPVSSARRQMARPADADQARVTSRLVSPSGKALAADDKGSAERGLRRLTVEASEVQEVGFDMPENQEVIHVADAEAGLYQLELATTDAGMAMMVVAAEPDSPLSLSSWAGPLSRLPGEPVVLSAELRDGEAPVSGARITARLAAPGAVASQSVDLFDDGKHGDGPAGDGVYAATLPELSSSAAGLWTVRFDAAGRNVKGHAFARTGSGGFVNEPSHARLVTGSAAARWIGDGDARRLRVTSSALVNIEGDYRLDVVVSNRAGDGLAWGEATSRLVKGKAPLSIDIPASEIGEAKGLRVEVKLLGLEPMGVAGRVELTVE